MQKFITMFILLFSFAVTNVHAANSSELADLLNSVTTMKSDFIQTIYDNRNKVVQQSTGQMAMQRPGRFRWDVKKPLPQLIIANQSRLWIYDPDLEQVTIRALTQAAGETPALLLSHVTASLDKEYVVQTLAKKTDGLKWFSLQPRSNESSFSSIQLGFMSNQMRQMLLEDRIGHTTKVEFKKIQMNLTLPASLFVFKAASNVDVIDETKKH